MHRSRPTPAGLLLLGWILLAIPWVHGAPSDSSVIRFQEEVMAVLSKAGCNAGTCHGNASGKGGLKLSLRGEDPEWDYQALVTDGLGRRLLPNLPEKSLVLLKATTQVAHEGGHRFDLSSEEYRILHQWIAQGARFDSSPDLLPRSLKVTTGEPIIQAPEQKRRIQVWAVYPDGSEKEVSTLAVYESANPLVTVSQEGWVTFEHPGETSILVRYLHLRDSRWFAHVPLHPDFDASSFPKPANPIDEWVFHKLKALKIMPSELCEDSVFLRRAYLDLLGTIPTAEETEQFLSDPSPEKRATWVENLLHRFEFADFWALKWADLMRIEEKALDRKGVQAFHQWIRQSILDGKPLDQFAREIISAVGSTYSNPPANYYRANRTPVMRAETTAQVFLGTRLQCAQCHNHPFDHWTQTDYYQWASVFASVQYKILENRRRDSNDKHEFIGEQIVYLGQSESVKHPKTQKTVPPRFLGHATPPDTSNQDLLQALSSWITQSDETPFASVQANRIWYHLMGRGLVDPIDDFRATNPASHPELLHYLTQELVDSNFDLRSLIRLIMNSRSYQLSSQPTDSNEADEINYSHAIPRRLSAEQLLDAQCDALDAQLTFNGYPEGIRASQIPGVQALRPRDKKSAGGDRFLTLFGKPPRLLPSETERSCEITMSQAFQLISSETMNHLLTQPNNLLEHLSQSQSTTTSVASSSSILETLFLSILSRFPDPTETASLSTYLDQAPNRKAALEDIAWSLLNTKEFLFRH